MQPGGLGSNDIGTISKSGAGAQAAMGGAGGGGIGGAGYAGRPSQIWHTSGSAGGQGGNYAPPSITGAMCTIVKTSENELVVTGDEKLLQEVFETDPGQWLRNLALTKEESNG